jgi:hypothetical protein
MAAMKVKAAKNFPLTTAPSVTGAVRRYSMVPLRYSPANIPIVRIGGTIARTTQKTQVPPRTASKVAVTSPPERSNTLNVNRPFRSKITDKSSHAKGVAKRRESSLR